MGVRSAQEIWEATLGELQLQVSKPNYKTWLAKTVGLSLQDDQFVVGVPNTFVSEYLDKNQRSLIEKTLIGTTGRNMNVLFYVNGKRQNAPGNSSALEGTFTTRQTSFNMFNPKYTFDSFVVGNSNHLAHSVALAVAQNPRRGYNPLFMFGGV